MPSLNMASVIIFMMEDGRSDLAANTQDASHVNVRLTSAAFSLTMAIYS